jgi:putative flippase GtrA
MTKRERFFEIARFLIAGGVGVLSYLLVFWALLQFTELWYIAASIVAFTVNLCVNYVTQKFWAFKSKEGANVGKQFTLYVVVSLGFLGANTGLLYVLVERMCIRYLSAQLITTTVLTITSFFVTRRILKT